MAEEDRGRRRGPGLLAGAVAVAAVASLGTLVLVESPAGPHIAGNLAASFVNPGPPADGKGTPTPDGKGKGTPTPDGKGKGTPTPDGKGNGTPTPGKGKGTPTPGKGTPTPGKGISYGAQPTVTTLATARQVAGFRVRTLDALPGAQLVRVTVQTVTFDTAPGQPTVTSVTLFYSLGKTQIQMTEVMDPLPMPASTNANALTVGGSTYLLIPRTGPVNAAETKAPDGVSIVVNFFIRDPAGTTGADPQTAQQVIQQLG